MKKIIFLFILINLFTSCDIYKTKDILEKGKQILAENKNDLEFLIQISKRIAKDSCSMYEVFTSRNTDFFEFSEWYFDQKGGEIKEGNYLNIEEADKNLISNRLPKNHVTISNI